MSVRTRRLIPLLAACSAIGSVGNFLFVPAQPQIAAHYAVGSGTAALTITAYLIAFAFGVLLSGPLADRHGRRPVLVSGVTLFGLAAIACYFAPTMGWFVAARVVQGLAGGAGITVSRASVGDLFDERGLARMYAILTMALVPVSAFAPYAGGLLTRFAGWQSGFLLLAAAAAVIVAACLRWLPETRSPDASADSFGVLWRVSRSLMQSRLFMGYVVQAALIYALFFVFMMHANHVVVTILGMPSDRFGLYYLFLAVGFFLGNLMVSRSAGHHDVTRQTHAGLLWQSAGAIVALILVLLGKTHPLWVFVPMMGFAFGQGLALPNLIAHGIRLSPQFTGVASSLFGFSQLALAAIAIQLMGYVPAHGWQPALWFCVIGAVVTRVSVWRLEAREVSPTRA
jgi:MFS transporter, DHA1 family, multidrug resistance protein